ncbi:MAG: hypothetical protein WCZ19_00590 [Acholeplasma sp.]
MNKYAYKVDSKIIKQLSLYLMLHDIKDFSIEFKSNGKIVQFIIKTKTMKQDIIDYMVDHIRGKRAPEIEVYGW